MVAAKKITVLVSYTLEGKGGRTKRCSKELTQKIGGTALQDALKKTIAKLEDRGAHSFDVRYEV